MHGCVGGIRENMPFKVVLFFVSLRPTRLGAEDTDRYFEDSPTMSDSRPVPDAYPVHDAISDPVRDPGHETGRRPMPDPMSPNLG